MASSNSSELQWDLSGATIQGNFEERDPTILLPNLSHDVSHLALDIGGSLIKLVYLSRHGEDQPIDDTDKTKEEKRLGVTNVDRQSYPVLGGMLHFVNFETSKINECLDFIYSKQLHLAGADSRHSQSEDPNARNTEIKATGGGAHKFADLFKERLGISIEKEDEMDCLVAGANFLLKEIRHEAFTHIDGQKEFVQIDSNDLFPYLLVNIGSGVSMIKVDQDGSYQRVTGTSLGGGTYLGLGKLLTKCKSFDELLELSQRGDNRKVDLIVEDLFDAVDYSKLGFTESTIASSFGKIVSESKELEDCRPEDISLSLLRMVAYNIVQISYIFASLIGVKRVFFGGSFIRGHAYTMDTISFALNYWSKGQMQAMFLVHEGFVGALGAFMCYEKYSLDGPSSCEKKIRREASNDLFPYLLVNIGSGVSIVKVDHDGLFQRVTGTSLGGGTYLGLGKLLTKCKSFDELLELSKRGDNKNVDLLVGDVYGGLDYSKIGLTVSTIASSFGKIISEGKELEHYRPEDISQSLLRMVSYNIVQLSHAIATLIGIKRIFFGGSFIRGHAYTMEIVSFALDYWSKGQMQAMFLRDEGLLGPLGAFMRYEKHSLDGPSPCGTMGAPYLNEKVVVENNEGMTPEVAVEDKDGSCVAKDSKKKERPKSEEGSESHQAGKKEAVVKELTRQKRGSASEV